jgi:uncharacterized membrane protein (DUF441 family)
LILGMSLKTFTYLHVAISLMGIGAGFIVVIGMINRRRLVAVAALFLITTALTSLTGFMFPFKGVTPGIVIGILSLIVLVLAAIARRRVQTSGFWRGTYVISSVLALFFNFFVLIVQSFEKIPALNALAPTQTELPFKAAQLAALVIFVGLATLAYRKFRLAE